MLTTGRNAGGSNTGVRSRVGDDDLVRARVTPEPLETYRDAVASFDSGDRRTIPVSRRERVPALVVPDDAVPAGLVWRPIHHPMTNHLTLDAADPDSDEPNSKQCAIRLAAPSARERHPNPPVRAHPDGGVDGDEFNAEPSDD